MLSVGHNPLCNRRKTEFFHILEDRRTHIKNIILISRDEYEKGDYFLLGEVKKEIENNIY